MLVAAVEVVSEEEDGRLTARVLREQVDKQKSSKPVRRQPTLGQRLEKARVKLEELEQVIAAGDDPSKALKALRRLPHAHAAPRELPTTYCAVYATLPRCGQITI